MTDFAFLLCQALLAPMDSKVQEVGLLPHHLPLPSNPCPTHIPAGAPVPIVMMLEGHIAWGIMSGPVPALLLLPTGQQASKTLGSLCSQVLGVSPPRGNTSWPMPSPGEKGLTGAPGTRGPPGPSGDQGKPGNRAGRGSCHAEPAPWRAQGVGVSQSAWMCVCMAVRVHIQVHLPGLIPFSFQAQQGPTQPAMLPGRAATWQLGRGGLTAKPRCSRKGKESPKIADLNSSSLSHLWALGPFPSCPPLPHWHLPTLERSPGGGRGSMAMHLGFLAHLRFQKHL